MGETRSVELDAPDERWVMLAVARDVDTAESWQAALDEADISSEIRLEDAVITGRSSATTYANAPSGDQLFSYGLWLPVVDREEAAQVLIDAGWDGRYGQSKERSRNAMSAGYVVRGTLVALAASALFVAVLLRAGGG